MTTSDTPVSQELQDFQDLLRDLFQFDVADLDFGVYRILNEKRDDIERFIKEDLVQGVREELEAYEAGKTEELREEVESKQSEIRATLGEDALLPDGSISEAYEGTPLAKEYRNLQDDLEAASLSVETERRIYDDLARFFNRYYDSGDFMTKRRFAAGDSKYYVPYDGEEVLLHWANRDQYYVKTTEHFQDYRFTVRSLDVHFKLVDAQLPQDNVKASDTRYFVLRGADPVAVDADAKTCTIRFAYRPITEEEDERLLDRYNEGKNKSNQRKTSDRSTIVEATTREILDSIDNANIRANLKEPQGDKEESPLRKHLNRYTAKHTADYFIHKDLGGFLRDQLELFIQNEVLQLDNVLEASKQRRVHQVDRAKIVKKIGERIIDFLTQIENFQKRLFEKKKFIIDTGYCVTLDRIPKDLHDVILKNEDQLKEWRKLYAVDEWEDGLFKQGYEDGEFTHTFIESHPHLMIDTRHFKRAFEDRLLTHLSDTADGGLDDMIDGLCIQGENFQTLNLIEERFEERIDCMYLDPPYNTGNDGFLYKDAYRHSSWLSMMDDRLRKSKNVLSQSGSAFVSSDGGEQYRLRHLMSMLFGEDGELPEIIWKKRSGPPNDRSMGSVHEYIEAFAKDSESVELNLLDRPDEVKDRYTNPDDDSRGPWVAGDISANAKGGRYVESLDYAIENPETGEKHLPPEGACWRFSKEKVNRFIEEGRIFFGSDGDGRPKLKRYLSEVRPGVTVPSIWDDLATNRTARSEMKGLFGENNAFDTPKPVDLIKRIAKVGSSEKGTVLDFFAGSGTAGHAVINLNREESENRDYILVEMGKYFDTVMLPRLKKAAYTDDWNDGVPKSQNGQSHVFRYHRLESYEDSLNNIEVNRPEAEPSLIDRFDDYALRYMLPHETRDSDTLLQPEAFKCPFDYTLQIQHGMESPKAHPVDLESTFNYLIGLEVESRRVYEHQDRRYVVITGTVEKEQSIDTVMVIWRNQDDLDLDAEKEWAAEVLPDGPFDTVYVNGPGHIYDKAEPLEIEFKRRMDPAAG